MIVFKKTRNKDNRYDTTSVKITSLSDDLVGVLGDFEEFLRACGYVFDGAVTIEYNEEDEKDIE